MERRIRVQKNREENSVSNSSELSSILNSFVVKLLFIGISVFIVLSVYNSIKITFQKLEILKQAEREVEDLRLQNLYLSLSMKDMSTDKYLEKEARDRLNFGNDEEIVFVIPANALEQAKKKVEEVTSTSDTEMVSNVSNISGWIGFLSSGI